MIYPNWGSPFPQPDGAVSSRCERSAPRPAQGFRLCGNDINDAWLAALAIEHRATLVSTDRGFFRFPGLDWLNPMKPL